MGLDLVERIRRATRAIVGMPKAQGAPPIYLYLPPYRATVAAVSADGSTVDVVPEASWLPKQSGVPLILGMPGVSTVIATGAIVRLLFSAGDPQRAVAALFESGSGITAPWTIAGDVSMQHLLMSQSGAPSGPPTASNGNIVINSGSTDFGGSFAVQGVTGQFSTDVTYKRGYKNGSFVVIGPADEAASIDGVDANTNTGTTGMNMILHATGAASKFTVSNKASGFQSARVMNGTYSYFVAGY